MVRQTKLVSRQKIWVSATITLFCQDTTLRAASGFFPQFFCNALRVLSSVPFSIIFLSAFFVVHGTASFDLFFGRFNAVRLGFFARFGFCSLLLLPRLVGFRSTSCKPLLRVLVLLFLRIFVTVLLDGAKKLT